MPIYEYHCARCAKDFELLVRTETRVACPSCAGRDVEWRLSLPARPATAGRTADLSRLGPPAGGGCCGGGGGCHSH